MTLDEFRATIADPAPPAGLSHALQTLWWDAKGDWNQAHHCAQEDREQTGSSVHAYLHRKEGDSSNAGYWYRRAGKPHARNSLDGFRVLADHGIKRIVLAADHGHLFGEEIGEDMKIEAPGGETADLHRRVWVGVGGTSEPSYLRTSLKALGVESDLDLATPWTLACFKSKEEPGRTSTAVSRPRS